MGFVIDSYTKLAATIWLSRRTEEERLALNCVIFFIYLFVLYVFTHIQTFLFGQLSSNSKGRKLVAERYEPAVFIVFVTAAFFSYYTPGSLDSNPFYDNPGTFDDRMAKVFTNTITLSSAVIGPWASIEALVRLVRG